MSETVSTSRYAGTQIQRISADLAYLELITQGAAGPVPPGRETVTGRTGGRAFTAAIGGRLVGFMLCLAGDGEGGPDAGTAETGLSAAGSRVFTRSALRVFTPVVAPAAAGRGISEVLLDMSLAEQPDGRIFAVLPAGHPANRVARAAGWHEVARGRSGMQLLLHPGHPALGEILIRE